jgi:hypothetical protein
VLSEKAIVLRTIRDAFVGVAKFIKRTTFQMEIIALF